MGENHFTELPTALYGFVLLMAAIAYWLLERAIIAEQGRDSLLATALGKDWKAKLSLLLYATGTGLAFVNEWLARGMYIIVAVMWFIPDPRIEQQLKKG
jgi:uncharacterized membrane protein